MTNYLYNMAIKAADEQSYINSAENSINLARRAIGEFILAAREADMKVRIRYLRGEEHEFTL